jgi:glucokinase
LSVFGVDVGGTKVAAGAVVGTRIEESVEHPTELSSATALLDGIAGAVGELTERCGKPEAVGIGMPSQIDFATGTVVASVNIPLQGVPLRQELGERFGVPVFVDNDANCAALAEAYLVPDPPAWELVMLTLGTGVGGGIVLDGKIFRGSTGLGAELGHIVIDPRAPGTAAAGEFPRPGSLEWLCSGTGIEREATRRGSAEPDSALGRIHAAGGRVTSPDAVAAAREGDAEALAVFACHAQWLGMGIASVVNTFEPERVVIGGGLSAAAELFLDAAREEAARWSLPKLWERVTVELARGGPGAGMLGAGLLAAHELARSGDTPRSESQLHMTKE